MLTCSAVSHEIPYILIPVPLLDLPVSFLPHYLFVQAPLSLFPSWILQYAPSRLYVINRSMNKVIFLNTKLATSLPLFKTCSVPHPYYSIPSLHYRGPPAFPAGAPFFRTPLAVPHYVHFLRCASFSLITISLTMLFLFSGQLLFPGLVGELLYN